MGIFDYLELPEKMDLTPLQEEMTQACFRLARKGDTESARVAILHPGIWARVIELEEEAEAQSDRMIKDPKDLEGLPAGRYVVTDEAAEEIRRQAYPDLFRTVPAHVDGRKLIPRKRYPMVIVEMTPRLAEKAFSALLKIMGPMYPHVLAPLQRMQYGDLDPGEQEALYKMADQINFSEREQR